MSPPLGCPCAAPAGGSQEDGEQLLGSGRELQQLRSPPPGVTPSITGSGFPFESCIRDRGMSPYDLVISK